MKKLSEGIIIPAITPFREDGNLDVSCMYRNYEKWNLSGVAGYMCLGSNGEFKALDEEESFQVIRTSSEAAADQKILIAGVGRESLYHTLKFTDRIARAGLHLDYISILTPHYFKDAMTDEAIIAYYTEIADSSPYPVLLYCAPGFANSVYISPQALRVLSKHPNIHGIKDTSPDMMDRYMDAVEDNRTFHVLAGSMGNMEACMKRGGKCAVLSAANYFPEECTRIIDIMNKEGIDPAITYLNQLKEIVRRTGGGYGIAGVKCCMNLRGYEGGNPRRPVLPIKREDAERIARNIKGINCV